MSMSATSTTILFVYLNKKLAHRKRTTPTPRFPTFLDSMPTKITLYTTEITVNK
jgi:methionine-rich copper-binding protein CopC